MNYKAFYRTYRPKKFEEVVGQDHIVKTLVNIIKMKKISHGYLFSGPRGTGKTSIAKIFANVINCIHSEKIEDICPKCLNDNDVSLDVIEIDAASNNGVNDIRTLREQVDFAPTSHPYKIYIIDEVHMLSSGAFNALLKTLEEPPTHAIFILATTNPDKIPDTILSRVQRYNFKNISKNVLVKQLKYIFDKENINYDNESLDVIANLANGSLRDALSIADQINAYSNSQINKNDIFEIFGLTSINNQIDLINYCVDKKVGEALSLFDNLANNGIDISKLIDSLINLLKDYLVYKKTGNLDLLEISSEENLQKLIIKSDYVYKVLDILTPLSQSVKYSDIPQQLFQLAIIKICSMEENLKDVVYFDSVKSIEPPAEKIVEELNAKTIKNKDVTDNFFVENAKDSKIEISKKEENTKETFLSEFNTNEIKNRLSFNDFEEEDQQIVITNEEEYSTPSDDFIIDTNEEIENEQNDSINNNLNIVKTSEININKNTFTSRLEEVEEEDTFSFKNEYSDTDELINSTTSILNEVNEDDGYGIDIDETILENNQNTNDLEKKMIYDTNEIDSNNIKDFVNTTVEITKEFELFKEDVKEKDTKEETIEYNLTQPNIVNLFLLADKQSFEDSKDKLLNASLSIVEDYEEFSILFKELKFISSNSDYILVSSKEDWIINEIHKNEKDIKFKKFISTHFGTHTHFFAITKKAYENSKELLIELKKANNVPKPIPLPQINNTFIESIKNDPKHKENENKVKQMFGGIFKK